MSPAGEAPARPAPVVRLAGDDVVAFLYHEARLLDERRYDEWVELFADDGHYWMPANEPGADPRTHVQIVYDDVASLRARITRLTTGKQYVQDPPSRTCHVVSNVYVDDDAQPPEQPDEVCVHSAFTAVESRRHHHKHVFAGRARHRLRRDGASFRIVEKRVDLVDNDQFYENLTFLL